MSEIALLNPTEQVPALRNQIALVQEMLDAKELALTQTKMSYEEYLGTFAAAGALREALMYLDINYRKLIHK